MSDVVFGRIEFDDGEPVLYGYITREGHFWEHTDADPTYDRSSPPLWGTVVAHDYVGCKFIQTPPPKHPLRWNSPLPLIRSWTWDRLQFNPTLYKWS